MSEHKQAAIEAGARAIFDEDFAYETENNPSGTPIKWPDWEALCECNLRGPGADCVCGRDDFEGTKYNYLRYAEEALDAMLPHLRAMIAQEIRAEKLTGAYRLAGQTHAAALEYAAQIVEGQTNE